MGGALSSISKLWKEKEYRILMVGLDAAGKTSILYTPLSQSPPFSPVSPLALHLFFNNHDSIFLLEPFFTLLYVSIQRFCPWGRYKLKLGEVVTTIPTIGFNVETVTHGKVNFTVWDVGGRSKIRALYRHYYENTQAIIYVVDSNDRDRIEQASEELNKIFFTDNALEDAVILVLANKQDLPNALSRDEVAAGMKLHDLKKFHLAECFETCATTGAGLLEALDWLSKALDAKRQKLPAIPSGKATLSGLTLEAKDTVFPETDPALLEKREPACDDLDDESFLRAVAEGSLPLASLTHRATLRLIFLQLASITDRSRGRQHAVDAVMTGLRQWMENGGAVFSLTVAYFWIQLVDLAMHLRPSASLDALLASCPWLLNTRLIGDYYTMAKIFNTPESLGAFLPPDVKPLPSVLNFNVIS